MTEAAREGMVPQPVALSPWTDLALTSESITTRGFDADKINAGIAVAVDKIAERGWQGDTCMITPDDAGQRCSNGN